MASTEQREKLYGYVRDQQRRRARMDDPAYRSSEGADFAEQAETAGDMNLAGVLMDSAAKAGTLNGKQADASPVSKFSAGQNDINNRYFENLAKQNDDREKRYGVDAKVYEYLAGKEQEGEATASTERRHGETLKNSKEIAEANDKRARDLKQMEIDAAKGLENSKQKNALALKEKEVTLGLGKKPLDDFDRLPGDKQTLVKDLRNGQAKKMLIGNQIESDIENFRKAMRSGREDDAVALGRKMLKVMNSTEGADAIGSEEAKRLGGFLEYKLANFTSPGKFIGRDLDKFEILANTTSQGIRNAQNKTEAQINQIIGRPNTAIASTAPVLDESTAISLPGETTATAGGPQEPDVAAYAAKHKIPYEQAAAIKARKTGAK